MSLRSTTEKVRAGGRLGRAGAREAMAGLMSGKAEKEEIKAFLLALNERGQDAEELAGFVDAMRGSALAVRVLRSPLIDTCGTGGDGLHTFNFSTAAALVAAGAGAAVAKHGNRAVSSRSGSADVLEELGVPIDLEPEEAGRAIEERGFAFLFAPRYHPAMKHVAPARKELGVRTVFNLLGPLVNPAWPRRQVVGLYDAGLMETYARVLLEAGARRAMVVRGEDGMDELTLTGRTMVFHADAKKGVWKETVSPEDAGLRRAKPEELRGGSAAENAEALLRVLKGRPGPLLSGTLLNAGAALLVAGMTATLREGVALARDCVASGKAAAALERLQELGKRRSP